MECWRIASHQAGVDFGRKGLPDPEIIVLLRKRRNVTFFTGDPGFYLPGFRHRNYCLVVMAVGQNEVAAFMRRFLRHPSFATRSLRMGRGVRVSHSGLAIWKERPQVEAHAGWN